MSVKILRLINNEEVIGKVEQLKGKYKVKNGAVVVPVGEGRLAMLPWLPHGKNDEVEIEDRNVILCFDPLDELANEYNTKIGSGLVVPPPSMAGMPGLKISGD